ncbi:MAG TPA: sulfatase, partial [Bryobacteraceae bacterium]
MGKFVFRCGMEGAAAWCAYAVLEFIFSEVLYALARPYTSFTPWHWRMTALLAASYAVFGLVAGAAAGWAVWSLRLRSRRAPPEACATLTLVLAFAVNMVANPLSASGKPVLLAAAAGFAALLGAALWSERWSERLGLLTNAWVVSGLLLGLGQEFALLELQDSARTLGTGVWLGSAALAAVWIAAAVGAVTVGRRLPKTALGWTAAGLAFGLIACGVWQGSESSARAQDSAPASGHSSRTNVVLIVMDTVRADHLGLYGYARGTTPYLARLARESAVYTRAFAPSDMTLASHASLFTGLYPSRHGAYCRPPEAAYGHELAQEATTLAERLSSHGYLAVGVSANVYLRAEFGLQRGFREFRIPRPLPVLPSESYWYLLRTGMRRVLSRVTDVSDSDRLYGRGEDIDREAFALLRRHEPSPEPLFLFLNYMDAHFPYIPPAPFDSRYPGKDRRIAQEDMEETSDRVVRGEPMPEAERRHRIAEYDGGIAYIDAQIGQVVDWLRERGLYDDTLIVVTADHGEAFGEKNLVLHANSVYQNLLHVPLLVKFPHSAHTGTIDEPVSLVDVAPTVLNALGYGARRRLDGRDLPTRSGAGPRELFSESFPCPSSHPPECANGCMQRAIVAWPHKLITSSSGRRELYDLASDPNELKNLYATDARAKGLSTDLGRW